MRIFGPPRIDNLKSKRDINGLIKALRHKNSDIRFQAAEALGEISEAPKDWAHQVWEKNLRVSSYMDGLSWSYSQWIEGLIGALKDNDSKTRQAAIASLMRICHNPDSKFGAAAISAILASRDKAVEEALVEEMGRTQVPGAPPDFQRKFGENLAIALNSPEGDLYLGKNSPLSPRTIGAFVSRFAKAINFFPCLSPEGKGTFFEPNDCNMEGALQRVLHKAAVQPLFAIIADERQLEKDSREAKETIHKKLFLVAILEKVMRLNLAVLEDSVLREIADFTLVEPTFGYELVDIDSELTLARHPRLGSSRVPTPGINSLAQEELRRRTTTCA